MLRLVQLNLLLWGLLAQPAVCRRKRRERAEWDPLVLQALNTSRCTVERLSASQLNPQRFEVEFRGQKPVVIEGLTGVGGDSPRWPAYERWQKASLLQKFGERMVTFREHTDAGRQRQAAGNGGTRRLSLAAYVSQNFDRSSLPVDAPLSHLSDVTYQFDRDFLQASAPELSEDFVTPDHFTNNSADAQVDSLFFLGAPGSGVGFHRHGEAWNAVVFGRKRWFLYPPTTQSSLLGIDFDLDLDGLGWYRRYLPLLEGTPLAPLECITGPGEVLYLPGDWYHATLNVADTIGIAVNHRPGERHVSVPVVPRDFHWGIGPLETLAPSSLEVVSATDATYGAGTDCRGTPPSTVVDKDVAACIDAVTDAAVVEVAAYIWCGEDSFGVTDASTLSSSELASAVAGITRLEVVTGLGGTAGRRVQDISMTSPLSSSMSHTAWGRAAYVYGLVLSGPGKHQDIRKGHLCLFAAMNAHYEPVGFKEHTRAVE